MGSSMHDLQHDLQHSITWRLNVVFIQQLQFLRIECPPCWRATFRKFAERLKQVYKYS
jgi:hypothetical protein